MVFVSVLIEKNSTLSVSLNYVPFKIIIAFGYTYLCKKSIVVLTNKYTVIKVYFILFFFHLPWTGFEQVVLVKKFTYYVH